MIVDTDRATPLPLARRYNFCIAGGGVAGIVLAVTLAERGRRVLLLEAGGLEVSEKSQLVYGGDITGRNYFPLDEARMRFLGGTSNHWKGWCRPLDAVDFEKRDYIDGSGWPIGIADLKPYLAEANRILEIPDFAAEPAMKGSNGRLRQIVIGFSPAIRFGEKYRDVLESSKGIDVFLNANLVDIERDSGSGRISAFAFRGYSDDAPTHKATAERYVLALGGIENARALLNANRQTPRGLGNDHDLVGRYFMEHPHHEVGYYAVDSTRVDFGKGETLRFIAPTEAMMRRERIANVRFRLDPRPGEWRGGGVAAKAKKFAKDALCVNEALVDLVRTLRPVFRCNPPWDKAAWMWSSVEQVPNRNSRVTLSDRTDRFGLRRTALDWRLLPQDKEAMRTGALEIAKYFARADIGRVKLFDWVLDKNDTALPKFSSTVDNAGYHHMGTTRMAASGRDGVVDRNCRVFGTGNLYVAGSSVFRTGGHTNPTLTIVQLALRLRDHLAPR